MSTGSREFMRDNGHDLATAFTLVQALWCVALTIKHKVLWTTCILMSVMFPCENCSCAEWQLERSGIYVYLNSKLCPEYQNFIWYIIENKVIFFVLTDICLGRIPAELWRTEHTDETATAAVTRAHHSSSHPGSTNTGKMPHSEI